VSGGPRVPAPSPRAAREAVLARVRELGFEAAGVAAVPPEPLPDFARFEQWLATGRHGVMPWLAAARNLGRRADPRRILPDARSIVCVALCHETARDAERDARLGRIARYAAGEDYHRLMRERLGELERSIEALLPGSRALWYADTGAILERAWAERAGLGWTGRHTGLISPTLGNWIVLGEVIVNREIEPDPPFGREHCGTCTRCLEACPTGALTGPGQLDSRRCISYLTIENDGPVPPELRPLVGDWVFGCDLCLEACPWNRFARPAREARLHADALDGWTLERFLGLDEAAFLGLFGGSAIRRVGRRGFLRNVCVALGNRGDRAALPALERARDIDRDALVREHAAWAVERIEER
jgi:epoxyqueuosine reductase